MLPAVAAQVTLDGSGSSDPDGDPLTYTWREGTTIIAGPTTSTTSGVTLGLGSHTIELTIDDDNGETDTDEVVNTVYPSPTADAGTDQTIKLGVSVAIGGDPSGSGGTPPYSFSWSPTAGLSDPTAPNPTARPLVTTTYTLTVTDANDCTGTDDVTVTVLDILFNVEEFVQVKGFKKMEGDIRSNNDIIFKKGKKSKHFGNLIAVDDVIIAKKNTINGDIIAGDDVDNKGKVNGAITENAVVDAFPLPGVPPVAFGTENVEVEKGETLALDPGAYRVVEVEKKGTLELRHDGSSGEYFLKTLTLKKKAVLRGDVSNGAVNVDEDLTFGKRVEVEITPGGEDNSELLTFNFVDDDDNEGKDDFVEIGSKAKVLGTIIAPDAWVVLKKKARFRGAICAENVIVGSKVVALHHGASSSLPKVAPDDEADEDDETVVAAIPTEFALGQNYPNPFNPSTTISFALPKAGEVSLSIYNLRGQLVQTLVSGPFAAGQHKVVWDGNDVRGTRAASGVYVYRLEATDFVAARKLVLTK